jgi:hypothetical protein
MAKLSRKDLQEKEKRLEAAQGKAQSGKQKKG